MPDASPPPWIMPPDLAGIVAEDGEWEDASWDPLLLSVVGDTRFEGRDIAMAWQLSLWADGAPDPFPSSTAKRPKLDGHGWADHLLGAIATRAPDLASRIHDDSDAMTCVLWVETERDGRAMMETVWLFLHREPQT